MYQQDSLITDSKTKNIGSYSLIGNSIVLFWFAVRK